MLLWDHVRNRIATGESSHDAGILSDGLLQTVRQLQFAIKVLNKKGWP